MGIGIEGGQYACLDALPIPLGGVGIYGFTINHLFELLCRLKEMIYREALDANTAKRYWHQRHHGKSSA